MEQLYSFSDFFFIKWVNVEQNKQFQERNSLDLSTFGPFKADTTYNILSYAFETMNSLQHDQTLQTGLYIVDCF